MILLFFFLEPNIFGETLIAHTDAVWDLAYQIDTDQLLSCSADGTCKLWNPSVKSPLIESYTCEGTLLQHSFSRKMQLSLQKCLLLKAPFRRAALL